MTASTCSRSKPSNHSIMSSMLAPAFRFSKMTETGMRVPFSTHAPLTFPGMLSTAGHCDQSSAAMAGFSFRSFYIKRPRRVPKTSECPPFHEPKAKAVFRVDVCAQPPTLEVEEFLTEQQTLHETGEFFQMWLMVVVSGTV